MSGFYPLQTFGCSIIWQQTNLFWEDGILRCGQKAILGPEPFGGDVRGGVEFDQQVRAAASDHFRFPFATPHVHNFVGSSGFRIEKCYCVQIATNFKIIIFYIIFLYNFKTYDVLEYILILIRIMIILEKLMHKNKIN